MSEQILLTPERKRIMERDAAIKADYDRLMAVPGQYSTMVIARLKKKYGFKATTSVYNALRRCEGKSTYDNSYNDRLKAERATKGGRVRGAKAN